ncbi:MAG: carbamate kinase [bacterium]|nr:carbamate kinase [bacterium]
MQDKKTAVVAIGGNFLSDGNSSMDEQLKRSYQAAELVKTFVNKGFKVVVIHGNGPQVGMTYLRQLTGKKEDIPALPLALCNALTQAEIGTLLELAIVNTINREKEDFDVLTLVSQVEVKADDPAFQNPTKPIGPFITKENVEEMRKTFPDWTIIEDSGRGYRRVVPSPVPIKVFSSTSIPDTFKTADVIIAGGGGGIPVIRKEDNTFELVDSVIDKDRTAFLVAEQINASHFVLLTGVPHVSINFGKPNEENLFDLTVADAEKHLADGQFPPGSMGPKIESAIRFAKTGGTAIITDADNIDGALEEKEGTRIHL